MAQEIERKFLVEGDYKSAASSSVHIAQGYLNSDPDRTVRVRIKGERAFLTVKGRNSSDGISRYEWEKEIPAGEAAELLGLCEPGIIDKTRYFVPAGAHVFEVDEFHADNEGLTVAEIELDSPEEEFRRPPWLGREVTGERKYYNSSLAGNPYKNW